MITPAEINTKRFEKGAWGYKTEEVDAFLTHLSGAFTRMLDENSDLEERIIALVEAIEKYKVEENMIKSAIMASQKLCDQMSTDAKRKSELIIQDATRKAENLILDARDKLDLERRALNELKKEANDFKGRLMALYSEHVKMITAIPEAEDIDEPLEKTMQGVKAVADEELLRGKNKSPDADDETQEHSSEGMTFRSFDAEVQTDDDDDGDAITLADGDGDFELFILDDEDEPTLERPVKSPDKNHGLKFGGNYDIDATGKNKGFFRNKK